MGLLLRPDVYYAEAPDGAHLLTHEGPLVLTGSSAYPLLDRVAPYLNGRYGLDELTADLTPERRQQVEQLISTLRDRGAVREISGATPPAAAAGAFRHEITYLDYFREDGGDVFADYRATTTLVLGSGRLLVETVAAAARSGLHRLGAAVTDECPTDPDELITRVGRARRDFADAFELSLLTEPTEAAVRSVLAGVDLVIHACDRPAVGRARLLERVCADLSVPLAQAICLNEVAWLAPVGSSWISGWRRLAARRFEAGHWSGDTAAEVSDVAAKAVAAQVVHGVLGFVTKITGDRRPALTGLDLSTLGGTTHACRAHPFGAADGPAPDTEPEFGERIAALENGPRLTEVEFSQRAASCVGDPLGVLGEPDERDFAQLPLHVCETGVSDPTGLLDHAAPAPAVVGAGLDFAAARYQSVLRGFALYGSLMVDPRRLLSPDGLALCDPNHNPQPALSALRTGHVASRLWACRVADGGARLVDARRVFPALHGFPPAPDARTARYRVPVGAAAGYGWPDAVQAGLLDHCRTLTAAAVSMASTPFLRIDLETMRLDEVGDRYRAMLAAIGDEVIAYDVTGPLGVPTVICCRAGEPVGCACDLTMTGAVRDAMEQALLAYQAKANDQPAYAPTPPALPEPLRGTAVRPPAAVDRPLSVADLAGALEKAGRCPVVVPLDHDPEVSVVMPYAVRVVLTDV